MASHHGGIRWFRTQMVPGSNPAVVISLAPTLHSSSDLMPCCLEGNIMRRKCKTKTIIQALTIDQRSAIKSLKFYRELRFKWNKKLRLLHATNKIPQTCFYNLVCVYHTLK